MKQELIQMSNEKLISSFYKVYKELHKKLENEIESDKREYISARILDRIIVFLFINKNLTNDLEREYIEKSIINSNNVYMKILSFYKNPECFIKERKNIVLSITKLFKTNNLEHYQEIDEKVIDNIIKKMNKFEWSFNENLDNAVTPDILGKVFEKYINQKETGAYYTEIDTIKYINRNAILYAFLNKSDIKDLFKNERIDEIDSKTLIKKNRNILDEFQNKINKINSVCLLKKIKESLKDFNVIDISVGTGAFILDAIDNINYIYEVINLRLEQLENIKFEDDLERLISIIENNVYGVDIMEDAVEMAKFRIYLKVISMCVQNNIDIDKEIKLNIKVGNALIGDISIDESKKIKSLEEIDNLEGYSKRFNWYLEFENVVTKGGFDCIIGNPPYIEYKKVINEYRVINYKTIKAGNIYGFMIERAINLLSSNGVIGYIVPISLVSTVRMGYIREFLEENCDILFYSNFGDRPGTLFNGVHQKLTILIAKKRLLHKNGTEIYTSQYYHWYKDERENLFHNIEYIKNYYRHDKFYYKIGNEIQRNIIEKVNSNTHPIIDMTSKDRKLKDSIFLTTRLTFWVKSFIQNKSSKEFKEYFFKDKNKALVFNAVLNSNLYYFWWETISDCWHLTNKELELFYFDYSKLDDRDKERLEYLSEKLEKSLEDNKKFIGSKQTDYEYKHKFSKNIIDEIDYILARHYGFNDKEYKYIIDYNLAYRMNDELDKYLANRNAMEEVI